MVYIINALIVILYGLIVKTFAKKRWKKLFFFLSFLHLFLLHALRNPYVYEDNDYYAEAYINIGDFSFIESITPSIQYPIMGQGYLFYNWLLNHISHDPVFFFSVTSLIIIWGITSFIYKYSYEPIWSTCFFILSPSLLDMSFFVLRQHLAAIFLLLALSNINRIKASIFFSILAILFHMSAVIFLPFYLFYFTSKWPIGIRRMVIWLVVIVFLFALGRFYFLQYYDRYTDYTDISRNTLPLLIVGGVFISHYLNGTYHIVRIVEIPLLKFLAYSLFILIGLWGTPGAARMSIFFLYPITVLFPLLFKYNKKEIVYQWKVLFSIGYSIAIFFVWLYVYLTNGFIEYQMRIIN